MPTITKPNLYFDTVTYTGTGATQTITGLNFQPDFVWIKSRSGATDNKLTDAVRGVTKGLISNSTAAETTDTNGVTAFTSSGFTLGSDSVYNNSGATYVAWCWKANGSGSSNTAGSITSTVSANTTSGFSVVTYTGNASGGQTIGHGLGVAPAMVIVKNRSAVTDWIVGHTSIGWTNFLKLNSTASSAAASTVWSNTAPTSTVVNIGSDGAVNGSTANMVAYCFAEVAGYSKFGSYTGNGSTDGVFVYTGFRPAYVMIKCTSAVSSWEIHDTKRAPYNADDKNLYANLSDAEGTYVVLDELSNGFKLRTTLNGTNQSGSSYIFAAFASAPLKYALAR